MLLSRVADALYWISRYLERAEHTARLVDVAVDLRLGRPSASEPGAIDLYGSLVLPPGVPTGPGLLAEAALFDASHRGSVAACVIAARENARQVREEISSEMWEQINALFLRLRPLRDEAARAGRTNDASRAILEGVHLVAGVTDATMGHGEGWQYLQVGRFLERAVATTRVLDTFFGESGPGEMPALDRADWVALLRSCSALEGYCRQYTADVRPERVTEFLLFNAEFPRSIRFAATSVEAALRALARHSGRSSGSRGERLSGRLRASLDYAHVDEVVTEGPRAYLAGVSRQCEQIHAAVYQSYISYPIESALRA